MDGNVLYYRQTTYKFYDKLFLFFFRNILVCVCWIVWRISNNHHLSAVICHISDFQYCRLRNVDGFGCVFVCGAFFSLSFSQFLSISVAFLLAVVVGGDAGFVCVCVCVISFLLLALQYLVSELTLISLFCFVSFGFLLRKVDRSPFFSSHCWFALFTPIHRHLLLLVFFSRLLFQFALLFYRIVCFVGICSYRFMFIPVDLFGNGTNVLNNDC